MPPNKRIRYCPVPGCGQRTNSSQSQYCPRHARNRDSYGHPEGDCLYLGELTPYLRTANQIIEDNLEHPDIVAWMEWIQRFLDLGEYMTKREAKHPSQDVRRWLGILQAEKITPQQILEMILAASLMKHERPYRFRDLRHFLMSVTHRVLKLARGHEKGRIKTPTRKLLSERLIIPLHAKCTTLTRLHYRDWEDNDVTMLEKAKSFNGFDFLPNSNTLPE